MGSEESGALDSASAASAPHLQAFSLQPHVQELRKYQAGRESRLTAEADPLPGRWLVPDNVAEESMGLEADVHPLISVPSPPSCSPE